MRGSVRKLIAVLLFHALWPAFALAQQSPAGVVTTLHGSATVARTAVPQEVPLKFKDDVFYRDRISTKESSIVRVLLGGKALVTVRELSVLTISEEPGRATVDLESGKIALAVARKLMRPGESIEIRTPNAIAAVRGTVVVVEVIRATAAAQLSPAAWTTIVSAVSDAVNVSAAGVSRLVTAGFSTNVLGLQPPGVPYPSPPTIFQGLTSPPQFSQNADSGNEVGKAETLATALTGGLPVSPPLPPLPPQQPPSTSNIGVQETAALQQVVPTGSLIQNGGLVRNGGFETGTFTGWQVFNQLGGSGDIFIFSGGLSPLSGHPVPAPREGHFAATTDQTGPGVHILSQVITIPSTNPMLQFDYFIGNRAGVFVTPNSITLSSFNVSCPSCPDANQQARVDILRTAAGIQDVGGGVLRMLARTNPNSQAVSSGWNTLAFDLSAFAGQTVLLRFTEVDNLFFFQAAVDDV